MFRTLLQAFTILVWLTSPVFAGDDKKESPYVVEIDHYLGTGHGCAVNGAVLTNRHMVDPRRGLEAFTHELPTIYFRYEWPDGTTGVGRSLVASTVADLAVVELDKEPPNGYAPLGPAPKLGDKVHWWEYDFRKRGDVFHPRRKEGEIVTISAGRIFIKEDIIAGASGGCLFNEEGEVLGLMEFGVRTKDEKGAAGAAALWGDWWEDTGYE